MFFEQLRISPVLLIRFAVEVFWMPETLWVMESKTYCERLIVGWKLWQFERSRRVDVITSTWNQYAAVFTVVDSFNLLFIQFKVHNLLIVCAIIELSFWNRPDVQVVSMWRCYDQFFTRSSETAADSIFFQIVILLYDRCKSLLSFVLATVDERCEVDYLWTRSLHKNQSFPFAVVSDADAAKTS